MAGIESPVLIVGSKKATIATDLTSPSADVEPFLLITTEIAMETHSGESDPRISVDPNIHFGKPCVAGTRIPVRDVLAVLRAGHSFEEITTDFYPDLDEADVQACVTYAQRHD